MRSLRRDAGRDARCDRDPEPRSDHPVAVRVAIAALLALVAPLAAHAQVPAIERVARIGCAECSGPTQFSAIFDVAVSDSGDVIVADGAAPHIRAFDPAGKLLWTSGRSGNGPGEFLFPARVAIAPDRSVSVLDMRQRRLTRLARNGTATGSHTLLSFPGASAARGRSGEIVVLADDFRGPFSFERWSLAATKPEVGGTVPRSTTGPSERMALPSIAVAASGIVAFALDPSAYRIGRLGADGRPMPDIVRDIPPVRRTAEEMKELSDRLANGPGRRAAEGSRPAARAPAPANADIAFKPHIRLDGLRFDDAGRLWVLTMRGAGEQSVFDIFTPGGALLGTVTLPVRVNSYSLAGTWLVTGGEDADDIPRLTLWRVRG